jgi:hypothetical protein
MTFLDDGGEGGSYSSKPSLSAQRMMVVKVVVIRPNPPFLPNTNLILYIKTIKATVSVYDTTFCCKNIFYVLTLWQNRPLIWVTSPDVTDSREKRNQGQSDFLRQKIW